MSVRQAISVSAYFGREARREREKAGFNILQLAKITGIDDAHLGRIERGLRPPTADIARRLDKAFPHRERWFSNFYKESRSWVPAQFQIWAEHEDPARFLWVWSPGIIDGLLQTEAYARRILMRQPEVTEDVVDRRLKNRLARQQRVLFRRDPPRAVLLVDLLSLYRQVGSPEIMAEQCARLTEVAQLPRITMQVMPAIDHGSNESAYIISESAAYAEHAVEGGVYQERALEELTAKFDALRAECLSASASLETFRQMEELWRRGASPLTAAATGASA
jgi:transcriptional regulator with XRE-family HTH domain